MDIDAKAIEFSEALREWCATPAGYWQPAEALRHALLEFQRARVADADDPATGMRWIGPYGEPLNPRYNSSDGYRVHGTMMTHGMFDYRVWHWYRPGTVNAVPDGVGFSRDDCMARCEAHRKWQHGGLSDELL